ncbi:MAG: bifunctional (p)ppGpp synthetase/guanosine-3',5'-bis(diphosphate) 3'-pyrophosphohydrolase [Chitinispirillaceae bacterium]|nr:bifunctional (p)ppGpp synthetase/guanosine-3',5'-bis(diphosphate) 3'-pyrophosphohydrolase [Chitinispirillaceae bacterium]
MSNILFLSTSSVEEAAELFVQKILEVNPKVEIDIIEKAFRFSWEAHHNQVRKSGEPFLAHPVAVAMILAEQKLDSTTIAAGLLHDVLEDTNITKEMLEENFGSEIALLVDGVTKIKSLPFKSNKERQAETYRKMLLSMAQDWRVIIIKFADRLHNLRTLKYLEPERIKEIAKETLEIYAPLAHRLGMGRIKWELEDLAFKHLEWEQYREIVAKVVASRSERETIIESFVNPLREELEKEGIKATIVGRPKHFYSIYRKMKERNKPFEEIYDLLAIRVIVNTVKECYHVLGIIHSMWTPIQDRFKDYISTPKSNGYQSLHTTVFGENGAIVEMQIRTWEMNQIAEDGIAAHWLYKSGEKELTKEDYALVWLKNLIEWQKDLTDSTEFFEFFKIDLFHAEIFVFTPKGDIISLPKGATVLDFAFAVHTDLGLHCIGAKVDGKIEPINKELKSGQTIEILKLNTKKPSLDWLKIVKTPKARSAIKRWLKTAGKVESIELGKKIIMAAYRKLHSTTPFSEHLPGLLQHLGITSADKLFELVGNGEVSVGKVMEFFRIHENKKSLSSRMVSRLFNTFSHKDSRAVLIGGKEDIMVRMAKCCNPIPGDKIIGFVTRGRGISVHRADCSNVALFENDSERKIEVSWEEYDKKKYNVTLEIKGSDRTGLLLEISKVFADFKVNIVECNIKTIDKAAMATFKIEISNLTQLKPIVRTIQKIKGIESVTRVKEYAY